MGAPSQLNVEYFFRLLYDCLRGACTGGASIAGIAAFAAHLWVVVSIVSYAIALVAFVVIIYCMMRLFDLRAHEHHLYGEVHIAKDEGPANPRWAHIESLIGSENVNDWRQAIIEADIMLDDVLAKQGYSGTSLGERLKQVPPDQLDSLNDAWEAHKVRNEIAHTGSSYALSEQLARRTIGRYEKVFNELVII